MMGICTERESRQQRQSYFHGWIGWVLCPLVFVGAERISFAQSETLKGRFSQLSGQHITIITDLPLDDDIRALPEVFDKAMPTWCDKFSVSNDSVKNWNATLYLMLDRQRFKTAGYIPPEVPEFRDGWQYQDVLWVMEQPSPYYRRHLMLHEGTHWFMYRKYGFYDTPWLAEGLSELMGTHRWIDNQLTMGVIPADRGEVPFWGRIKIVRDQCTDGFAPSLEDILSYSNTAHQNVDAYAWSWALTLFLENHPDTQKLFRGLLKQPAMRSREVEKWLRSRLNGKLPRVRTAWRSFVSDLDYGYTANAGMLTLSDSPTQLSDRVQLSIQANSGWQASHIRVSTEDAIHITCDGTFSVAQDPKPWLCTADGVTLEYYRGQPLGKMLMVVAKPLEKEGPTELIEPIGVGSKLDWKPTQDGELFFKVNESSGNLQDNQGEITVTIQRQ